VLLHTIYLEIDLLIISPKSDGLILNDIIEYVSSRRIFKGIKSIKNFCATIFLKPNKSETLIQGNPSFLIAFFQSERLLSKEIPTISRPF
jgi:hypothetical protein